MTDSAALKDEAGGLDVLRTIRGFGFLVVCPWADHGTGAIPVEAHHRRCLGCLDMAVTHLDLVSNGRWALGIMSLRNHVWWAQNSRSPRLLEFEAPATSGPGDPRSLAQIQAGEVISGFAGTKRDFYCP